MNVKIKISVKEQDGANVPLRRAYVEHLVFGTPVATYITDDQGDVRDQNGNLGIQSQTPNVDIRVLCQNSVAKVLNGAAALMPVWQDFATQDGGEVVINTSREQVKHYRILNRCLLSYDRVLRQFNPFRGARRPNFPLGYGPTLADTKARKKRIEVAFPDNFPLAQASFTEPASGSTGYPLMHLQQPGIGLTIAEEIAHALHFSLLTRARRDQVERDYLLWIATDAAVVGPPNGGIHRFSKRTSQMVAFIEAMGHFAHRFEAFIHKTGQSGVTNDPQVLQQRRQAFIDAELSSTDYWAAGLFQQAGIRQPSGTISPNTVTDQVTGDPVTLTGADMEGAVYGAIFLDFANRVGLRTAVTAYLRSGALDFGSYRQHIHSNLPQHAQAIDAVQQTWGL